MLSTSYFQHIIPHHFYMQKYNLVFCTSGLLMFARFDTPTGSKSSHLQVGVLESLQIRSVRTIRYGDTAVISYCTFSRLFRANQFGKLRPIQCMGNLLVRIEREIWINFAHLYLVMPWPAFNNPVTFTAGRLDINGHVHGQRWTV